MNTSPEPFFFRTSGQYEIDWVLAVGKELWAVEIKLTSALSPDDLKAGKRVLVSQTKTSVTDGRQMSCSLSPLLKLLRKALS